ncbi:TOMM system kinase/cyclase fusion protein [Trinickia sp. NRRL B-1857]|uniref:TOMM system kinase/cyclase fusion protein n=1 Tax=Trinickia sp. NRRL B-1857 TaxID=3162879 RepID=UPI003D2D61F5
MSRAPALLGAAPGPAGPLPAIPAPPDAPLVATHRYRVGAPLGEGATGVVYEAWRVDTGERVAIKLLREDATRDADERTRLRARFRRETQLCARLTHAHIVALLDNGETSDGRLFAVFEHVPGQTLRAMLAADGPLPAETAGHLMAQVLDGLAHAHRGGVVHRDLKPQNVMVTRVDGALQAKILDFGIGALLPNAQLGDELTLTRTDEVLGSPQYCSPEQLRGEPPTAKSDLYAWGLVVIECLTGQPVMQGSTVADILYQQLSPVDVGLPPAIAAHPLGAVLREALNKDPKQRAESAEALAARFRAVHFAALVGALRYRPARRPPAALTRQEPDAPKATTEPAAECRQVTALCCSVSIAAEEAADTQGLPEESLDAYQAQWLTRCTDIAIRYGGHAAGMLGDLLLFYFGYPDGIDRPAQRACRAALEMTRHAAQSTGRPAPPDTQSISVAPDAPAMRVEIAAAIHTGTIASHAGTMHGGITAGAVVRLQRMAQPGHILLSEQAARRVERHVDSVSLPLRFVLPGTPPQPVRELLGERYEHAPFDALEHGAAHPMVGRERELAALMRAWESVQSNVRTSAGPQRMTLVVGDAGMGKSRLVHELREAVRSRGHGYADCACLPDQTNHALAPLLRFVKTRWHLDVEDPNASDPLLALQHVLQLDQSEQAAARATLAAWLGRPLGADLSRWSGARQQHALFDMLCQLLASLSPDGPVLLIVEDVQWIDDVTIDFLDALTRHPCSARICVVLTSRPEALERWKHRAERIALRRLPRAAAHELATALMPGIDVDPRSLDRLVRRADGIPLFVEELVRELESRGAFARYAEADGVPAAVETDPLPGSLREVLELSLERVDGARDTVQLAAAIGLEFDARLLTSASAHSSSVVEDDLRRLLEGRILYAQHRLSGVAFVFRHALLRDAAYESMPAAARRACHLRIARALSNGAHETDQLERCAATAGHFARAQAFSEAVPFGMAAARRALERALHDDAIHYARTTRDWLGQCDYPGHDRDYVALDLTLSHALMARYGWGAPHVRESADRMLTRAAALQDPTLAGSALWTIALHHHVAGDRGESHRIGAQLTHLARTSGRDDLAVVADTICAMNYWVDGEYAQARSALEAALDAYRPARDHDHRRIFGLDTRAWAMSSLAGVVWCIDGDDARAVEQARSAVHAATCSDHLPTIGVTMMYMGRMQQWVGDREGARVTSSAILELSRIYGLNAVERYAAILQAWCVDDLETAVANVDALKQTGCMLGLTFYASLVAELDVRRGNFAHALVVLDECLSLSESTGERYYLPQLLVMKARYLRERHDEKSFLAARESCVRAIAAARRGAMRHIADIAQTELRMLQEAAYSTTGEAQ